MNGLAYDLEWEIKKMDNEENPILLVCLLVNNTRFYLTKEGFWDQTKDRGVVTLKPEWKIDLPKIVNNNE